MKVVGLTFRHVDMIEQSMSLHNDLSLCYCKGAPLTLIYPAHLEDVPCQSGVNHIFEG